MASKPTYKELEKKVNALAQEVKSLKSAEQVDDVLKKNERLFRAIIEHSAFVYDIIDLQGNVIYASPSLTRVYGWQPEEIMKKSIFDLVHPDDIDFAVNSFGDLLNDPNEPKTVEVRYKHKDGSWRNIEVSGINLTAHPAVRGIALISHDITEKKQIEKALKDNEDRYRHLINHAHDGIVVLHKGILKLVNPYLTELTGYSVEELEGAGFHDFIPSDELPFIAERYQQRMAGEDVPAVYESKILKKDGSEVAVEYNTGLITFEGEPSLLVFIRDISERISTEKTLRESEQKFRILFESSIDGIVLTTTDGTILDANQKIVDILGYQRNDVVGESVYDFNVLNQKDMKKNQQNFKDIIIGESVPQMEFEAIRKDKSRVFIGISSKLLIREGYEMGVLSIVRDISERKIMEAEIKQYNEKLEEMVQSYTSNLEEANIALRLMLKKEDEVKNEIEEKIVFNIKQLVMPYLEIVKNRVVDDRVKNYLDIIDTNLEDVVSPFVKEVSSTYYGLTPAEIQIANLIKQGKTSKEIAGLLNLSPATITTHRNNIREKLYLRNKKVNLRAHLSALKNV